MVEGRRISFPSRGALKIAVPVSLTILLYTLSLFFVVLPAFEGSILERKRENVRHLTQTAWSVLVHLERRAAAGDLTREAAQAQAVAMLRDVRFGPEGKDYFWVNDMHPRMVVHPYRPDLEGHDISDFADPNGERLFVRFVEMVRREGEGWVPYLWQWKDDPARVVPKISYVKGFAPWAWVVGSGLYLDDVREEIAAAARRLTWLSFAIVALTGLLSGFVIWQGARFERARRQSADALRRLNEELEERVARRTRQIDDANRELEAYNYAVSHDLRGPVHTVLGYASLLQEDHERGLDLQARDYVYRIDSAARRMSDMIDGLLQLSRLSRAPLERSPLDLSAMAREVAAGLQAEGEGRQVEIHIEGGLRAFGHEALVHAVLHNLLANAWKYSRNEPVSRIDFGARREGGECVYHVRDNGAGFDMSRAESLFRPFRRLHSEREFEGSGIGLATVQRIVHRHGGRIWAESSPGAGATFYFTLGEEDGVEPCRTTS